MLLSQAITLTQPNKRYLTYIKEFKFWNQYYIKEEMFTDLCLTFQEIQFTRQISVTGFPLRQRE